MATQHGRFGKVSEISDHHDGEHASITVKHGRRKRPKDDKGQSIGPLNDYSQPTTRIHVSKADAKNYKLGQKVHVGISPAEANEEGNDDDMDYDDAPATAQPGAVAAPAVSSHGAAAPPAPKKKSGRIARAMHRPAKS